MPPKGGDLRDELEEDGKLCFYVSLCHLTPCVGQHSGFGSLSEYPAGLSLAPAKPDCLSVSSTQCMGI